MHNCSVSAVVQKDQHPRYTKGRSLSPWSPGTYGTARMASQYGCLTHSASMRPRHGLWSVASQHSWKARLHDSAPPAGNPPLAPPTPVPPPSPPRDPAFPDGGPSVLSQLRAPTRRRAEQNRIARTKRRPFLAHRRATRIICEVMQQASLTAWHRGARTSHAELLTGRCRTNLSD